MSDEDEKKPEADAPSEEELDLDEDLAEALDEGESAETGEIDIDNLIESEDPGFAVELNEINSRDFEGVVISNANVSDEVDENEKGASIYKTFFNNIPKETKSKYYLVAGICSVMIPIALLILNGKLLPRFELPYLLSMDELTTEIYSYDTSGPEIPLFDQFRNTGTTVSIQQTLINLKVDGDRPAYAQFEFKFNVRDDEVADSLKRRESEVIDRLQVVLAQVTLRELQTPMGKEKVKKNIRHQLNTWLQGNLILGVYYHTVLLNN